MEFENANENDQFKVRFVNRNPVDDNLDVFGTNISSINSLFYHHINSSSSAGSLIIRCFYNQSTDGDFQSVCHWEENVPMGSFTTPFWRKTHTNDKYLNSFPDLSFVEVTGHNNFNGEPFVLGEAGFYVNTSGSNSVSSGTNPGGTNSGGGTNPGGTNPSPGGNEPGGNGGASWPSGNTFGNPGVVITINSTGGNSSGGGIGNPAGTGSGAVSYSPFPAPGDYEIEITSGECTESGIITFTVTPTGNITDVNFLDENSTVSNPLSPDLFYIDPVNTGIVLYSAPPVSYCLNTILVQIGTNGISLTTNENIIIDDIPAGVVLNSITFYKGSSTTQSGAYSGFSSNTLETVNWSSISPFFPSDGAYRFVLEIDFGGNTESIEGYFIVKL